MSDDMTETNLADLDARTVESFTGLFKDAAFAGEAGPISMRTDRSHLPGHRTPVSLFMIYLKFDPRGGLIVKQLRENPFAGTLDQAEARLLQQARGGAGHEGVNFRAMEWQREYYITVVIDNPGWTFFWGPDEDHEAIRFLRRKDGSTQLYRDNHTFFNAETIPLGDGDAFRCVNYFRDENGEIGHGPPVKYCFEIVLMAPFALTGVGQRNIKFLLDPDGQNQGPRV